MKAKKILITLLVALVMCSMSATVLAGGDVYLPGDVEIDTSAGENVGNLGSQILGIIRVAGTIGAVGILMVLGIKYMMGSTEEKAEYKKTMLPYIIGAVLLFAAVQIAGIIANMGDSITGV